MPLPVSHPVRMGPGPVLSLLTGNRTFTSVPVGSYTYTLICTNISGTVSDTVRAVVVAPLSGTISVTYPKLLLMAQTLGQPAQTVIGTVSGCRTLQSERPRLFAEWNGSRLLPFWHKLILRLRRPAMWLILARRWKAPGAPGRICEISGGRTLPHCQRDLGCSWLPGTWQAMMKRIAFLSMFLFVFLCAAMPYQDLAPQSICAQVYGVTADAVPLRRQNGGAAEDLSTTNCYDLLAGKLLSTHVVNGSSCPGTGLNPDGSPNACGIEVSQQAVTAWQCNTTRPFGQPNDPRAFQLEY